MEHSKTRALETLAIFVGFAGLALAVLGPSLRGSFGGSIHMVDERAPSTAPVRGAPLRTMGVSAMENAGVPGSTGTPIPNAAFEAAARFDGIARRGEDGTLSFDLTADRQYLRVPMSALASFAYDPVHHPPAAVELGIPAPPDAVPDEILALDGRDVSLVGFMVAIDVDERGVKAFVLSQNRSFCCYGITPALNEMVLVEMEGEQRAAFFKDVPIAVSGTLAVSEEREYGEVVSLYRMEAAGVTTLRAHAQAPR